MKINFLTLPLPEHIPAATGQTKEKYIQPRRKAHLDFEYRLLSNLQIEEKQNNRKNIVIQVVCRVRFQTMVQK